MPYSKTIWQNNTAPAINSANLNNIETGISDAHNDKLDKADHTKAAHDALGIDADTLDGSNAADFASVLSQTVNLMTDSGRFAGKMNPLSREAAGAFTASGFFSPFNSASAFISAGKFIHDNSTNGGAGGALTQDVIDLMAAMGRTGTNARFGVEFYVAETTAGAGTAAGIAYPDGVTRYALTTNGNRAIFGLGNYSTAVFWVRLKSEGTPGNKLGIRDNGNLYRGGVAVEGHQTFTAADGWTHVTTQLISTIGYNSQFPLIDALAGDVVQIACPAFFAGRARPGVHAAPLPTINELIAV